MSTTRKWSVPRIHETPTQRQGVVVSAAPPAYGYGGSVAIDDSAILTPKGARRLARTLMLAADYAEKRKKGER